MKIIFCFYFTIIVANLTAQCITYTYDAAGDRTSRNICPEAIRNYIDPITTNNAQVTRAELNNHDINIYPNPTFGFVEVRSEYLSVNSQILITDILGRKFYSRALMDGKIDFSSLMPGRYYLRITDGNIVRVVSVIKQ